MKVSRAHPINGADGAELVASTSDTMTGFPGITIQSPETRERIVTELRESFGNIATPDILR